MLPNTSYRQTDHAEFPIPPPLSGYCILTQSQTPTGEEVSFLQALCPKDRKKKKKSPFVYKRRVGNLEILSKLSKITQPDKSRVHRPVCPWQDWVREEGTPEPRRPGPPPS